MPKLELLLRRVLNAEADADADAKYEDKFAEANGVADAARNDIAEAGARCLGADCAVGALVAETHALLMMRQ